MNLRLLSSQRDSHAAVCHFRSTTEILTRGAPCGDLVLAPSSINTKSAGSCDNCTAAQRQSCASRLASIPLLGAVMAIRTNLLAGIHLALAADVLLTLTAVAVISAGLNRATGPTEEQWLRQRAELIRRLLAPRQSSV